jgi:hypothetical protein
MNKSLDKMFNWKKHPESIFPLVIPIAMLAVTCLFTTAVLQLIENHDPWYLVILFVIGIPGTIAIVQAVKILQRQTKEQHERKV